ncbi:hypothetical protein F2P81_002792 [Scophthalmus maximus]|uniref:Solute carrier family 15 member 1-like n=1 Tax=Scophthalmus maximus TaxID=52904 RepID=A0A6A4TJP1_SCOMX|nr:hypothetical protein F2P81_002792 [Scophthalmus maximus]
MYNKTAPQGNIMVKVCKCIGFAVKNRFRHRSSQYPKKEHWMDWAEDKYDKLLIAQVKMVLKVLFLYIPLPMFWALFDQQGVLIIQPDQMQTVNPILILILVPIVDSLIYPLISKCKLNFRFFNGFDSALNVTVGNQDYGETVPNNMSTYVDVPQGDAQFRIWNSAGQECVYSQKLGFGSSYTLIIPPTFTYDQNCSQSIRPVMNIGQNSFHMAWQIPQYFLITAGEVVFSVTGLEFSYSQAPSNMKSVLQAGWLLTVAVGNIIVLIVAEAATLSEQWAEYILFASLLVVVCFVFAFMAYFYTYIDPTKIEAEFAQKEPEEKGKTKSLEMVKKMDPVDRLDDDSSSSSSSDNEEKM